MEPVLHDNDGLTLVLKALKGPLDEPHRRRIEVGRRFVEHEGIGAHRAGGTKREQLALASGKIVYLAPDKVMQSQVRHDARDAFDHFVPRNSQVLAAVGELGCRIEVEELAARILEHRTHDAAQIVYAPLLGVATLD